MRRHLNTIYVTSEGAYCRGTALTLCGGGQKERGRAPIHVIGGLVCLGRASVSPLLMNACAEAGVHILSLRAWPLSGPRRGAA